MWQFSTLPAALMSWGWCEACKWPPVSNAFNRVTLHCHPVTPQLRLHLELIGVKTKIREVCVCAYPQRSDTNTRTKEKKTLLFFLSLSAIPGYFLHHAGTLIERITSCPFPLFLEYILKSIFDKLPDVCVPHDRSFMNGQTVLVARCVCEVEHVVLS